MKWGKKTIERRSERREESRKKVQEERGEVKEQKKIFFMNSET